MPCNLTHEDLLRASGVRLIAGIDEAGRGPLAGPVVAAAVILPEGFTHGTLNDSKQLCVETREELFAELIANEEVRWACAILDAGQVDRLNILRATHQAMREAVAQLVPEPQHVLIDGLQVRPFPI